MPRLTEDKYKCIRCGERKRLVVVRGRASLCKDCYNDVLAERRAKRQVIKEINIVASEILRGK